MDEDIHPDSNLLKMVAKNFQGLGKLGLPGPDSRRSPVEGTVGYPILCTTWYSKQPFFHGWKWWFPTIFPLKIWFIIPLKQQSFLGVCWNDHFFLVKVWFIIQLKQPLKRGCLEFQEGFIYTVTPPRSWGESSIYFACLKYYSLGTSRAPHNTSPTNSPTANQTFIDMLGYSAERPFPSHCVLFSLERPNRMQQKIIPGKTSTSLAITHVRLFTATHQSLLSTPPPDHKPNDPPTTNK